LPCFGGPLLRSEHADVWVVSRTDATVEGTCWTAGKHTKEPPRLRGEVLACADLLSIYGNPQRDPLASVRKVLAREPTTGTVQRDPLASVRKVLACATQGTVQRDPLASARKVLACANHKRGPYKGILLASAGKVLACANQGNVQRDPLASAGKVLACANHKRGPYKGIPSPRRGRFWRARPRGPYKGIPSPRRGRFWRARTTRGTVQRDPLASARKVLACAFQGTVQRDPPRLGGEGSGVREPRKGTQQRDPSRLGGEILARGSLLCHAGNRAMGDLSSLGKGGSSACGDRKDHLGRGLLRSTIAKFLARPMILFWCGPSGLRTSWLTSVRCEGGCGRPCSFQGSGASYCAGKVRASH